MISVVLSVRNNSEQSANCLGSLTRALMQLNEHMSLAAFLWDQVDGRPQINAHRSFKGVPAQTASSKAISKALKGRGFRFVGPTTVYAFMQATGMVNDHLVTCFCHGTCGHKPRSTRLKVK